MELPPMGESGVISSSYTMLLADSFLFLGGLFIVI